MDSSLSSTLQHLDHLNTNELQLFHIVFRNNGSTATTSIGFCLSIKELSKVIYSYPLSKIHLAELVVWKLKKNKKINNNNNNKNNWRKKHSKQTNTTKKNTKHPTVRILQLEYIFLITRTLVIKIRKLGHWIKYLIYPRQNINETLEQILQVLKFLCCLYFTQSCAYKFCI